LSWAIVKGEVVYYYEAVVVLGSIPSPLHVKWVRHIVLM
jgi:hypothetical protein